jgi:hypothetical protein
MNLGRNRVRKNGKKKGLGEIGILGMIKGP